MHDDTLANKLEYVGKKKVMNDLPLHLAGDIVTRMRRERRDREKWPLNYMSYDVLNPLWRVGMTASFSFNPSFDPASHLAMAIS
ncbi:hypothetical protein OUZ56_001052 [Daphnia magna]|uniref:Uncharacterized protein n=1 Tax=Daphnia magna TaxID=35525 RepID=A0ABR0A1M5_9CRUS|nr:hypothetical protein OUZ56_001052 [Daphnia magna]